MLTPGPDAIDTPVQLIVGEHIGQLVLNRPAKLNAIDGDTLQALEGLIDEIERDQSIRAVLVRGNGRAFCAGADLAHVEACLAVAGGFASFLDDSHRVFSRLERCSKPSVASVHGGSSGFSGDGFLRAGVLER
jgi:enoyl-CoA hydratase